MKMTCVAAAFACLSVSVAQAKCPARFDGTAPAAWGAPTGTSDDDRLYELQGVRMLDRKVAYVIAHEAWGKWVLSFRLAGEVRLSGEALSQSLRDKFAGAYPGAECSELKASCRKGGFSGDNPGDLDFIDLQDDSPPGRNWKGGGARLVAADEALEGGPVFLVCSYYQP